jgi:poly-gamma-glutamate capsule biosynthesis protein CapA/YwtB (metallophosphatase superfamily)
MCTRDNRPIRLFLCGDVMTGRGIDQILPHPGNPAIYESHVRDARDYVRLAERVHGPIPRRVAWDYVWGDALPELERAVPDARIINLETSITRSDDFWPGKGINYRMHPRNIGCLTAARIDCCALANNHVLDWGYDGLAETLRTLDEAGIAHCGAGRDLARASEPAVINVPEKGRVLVFSLAMESSGVPEAWAASSRSPGIHMLDGPSAKSLRRIVRLISEFQHAGDVIVASIHWGSNWGFDISEDERVFARGLLDHGAHIVHGHSSHHVKTVEIHDGRLAIFGCGDFINDYEGIGGHEAFRGDLSVLILADLDPETSRLAGLRIVPLQSFRFRLRRCSAEDARWLCDLLDQWGAMHGIHASLLPDQSLAVTPVA